MNHDTIVDDWQQNAEVNDDENYEFLRSMKFRDYGFDPDELAGQLHEQAFQIVDCTRCANCCKTMGIVLSDEDVERIAGHLEMEIDEFIQTYLEPDAESHVLEIWPIGVEEPEGHGGDGHQQTELGLLYELAEFDFTHISQELPLEQFHFSQRRSIFEIGWQENGQMLELRVHTVPLDVSDE